MLKRIATLSQKIKELTESVKDKTQALNNQSFINQKLNKALMVAKQKIKRLELMSQTAADSTLCKRNASFDSKIKGPTSPDI